jgi:Lon protease-like protein
MNPDPNSLDGFDGTARLFPLPSLVFFPHVGQPLHVFEPRYRQMTADALAGDRLIAPVLLRPGWEQDYDGRPPIHTVACLGRVVADQRLPDGRFNLLLHGLSRVLILDEPPTANSYRTARVELMPDTGIPDLAEAMTLRRRLAELVLPRFAGAGPGREQASQLFHGERHLSELTDILSFALTLPMERKQELLDEPGVAARAMLLVRILEEASKPTADRRFPPNFSPN